MQNNEEFLVSCPVANCEAKMARRMDWVNGQWLIPALTGEDRQQQKQLLLSDHYQGIHS